MLGKLFNKKKTTILVTNPIPGQRLYTACRRGRIVYTNDSEKYKYIIVWQGRFLPRIPDLYLIFRLFESFGAKFNEDELVWR
jgi:hypothetical protein